ncbi:unnamed protein product [Meloidogyne enterolobii]|uniref:Uncharacterized protein n=1 Tax=Meloidogyne enterolobii TaxID=390850 RepID=A0ACB0YJR6_MELEN
MSAIALRQQQSVRRLLTTTEEEDEEEEDEDDDDEEEETSSNSMPLNNTTTNACGDGRRREIQGDTKKMSSFEYNNTSRSENNSKTVASAYMAMKQSNNYSKSSSTPHGLINIGKIFFSK